ncbi:MAG TPA: ferritin-like domain-containing protein [Chthonomonadaceae bacterium]|nr:ferritin-like domain-containing protein [Chthonomonadaceae bacterium]
MELATLQDLFVEQLQDLYDAEQQILKALPKMSQAATSPQLKQAFDTHEQQTRTHVQRLEQIFQRLGKSPQGQTCKGMRGLIAEGEELMKENARPSVRDAGLITAAQRVEHYEIAGYGTVRTYAQEMGDQESMQLLQQTLDEEGETDKKLTQIAESTVNVKAETGAGR